MHSFAVHAAFDVLAWLSAGVAAAWIMRGGRVALRRPRPLRSSFLAAPVAGAALRAILFVAANLWLSGQSGLARSIEGAVAGGIIAIELYKHAAGIATRTGARFALPFAVGVAVGR